MSTLEPLWSWIREPAAPPTEDEIFDRWVAFSGSALCDGCTLDEFREAYLNTLR